MILDTDDVIERRIRASARVSAQFLSALGYIIVGYREGQPLISVRLNEILYALGTDQAKILSFKKTHRVCVDLDTEFYILEGILFDLFNGYVFQVNAIHDKNDIR